MVFDIMLVCNVMAAVIVILLMNVYRTAYEIRGVLLKPRYLRRLEMSLVNGFYFLYPVRHVGQRRSTWNATQRTP